MNKVKRQRAILLISMLSAYFVFSDLHDFFSVAVPELDNTRQAVETQVGVKKSELGKLRQFAKNIEGVKQELRELDIQLETALEAMPRAANFAELLRRMDMLAENSGIELQTFRPMSNQGVKPEANAFYSILRVEFNLRGSFTQTLMFFDQISRLKRLVNFEQLKFRLDGNVGRAVASKADSPLVVSGVIKVFQFSE